MSLPIHSCITGEVSEAKEVVAIAAAYKEAKRVRG